MTNLTIFDQIYSESFLCLSGTSIHIHLDIVSILCLFQVGHEESNELRFSGHELDIS